MAEQTETVAAAALVGGEETDLHSHAGGGGMQEIMLALKMLYQAIVNPPWVDKSANQLRAQVTGTLTTVTTVTGITNLNAYAANLLIIDQNRAAWASVVRSRIA